MKKWMLLFIFISLLTMISPLYAQETVQVTILNTADEHGWILPTEINGQMKGGFLNLEAYLIEKEGYRPESDQFLLLSGGDNWTGPAISTWFEGKPMIEAMNQLAYDASAIGNHEFDFGRDIMLENFGLAQFPYLAANIYDAESGALADFAIPYQIFERAGIKIGVIGLTTQATVSSTHPKNISDLRFGDYVEALQTYVPQMRAEGADFIIGLTHVCPYELNQIASRASELVDLLLAGHCNARDVSSYQDVLMMGAGDAWRSYGRVDLFFDPASKALVSYETEIVDVLADADYTTNADTAALIASWETDLGEELNEVIGYSATGIPRRSTMMENLVTDAWLWAYPADVAITNTGGIRADLPAGDIHIADIVTILPFDNRLVQLSLSAQDLADNLYCCGGAVAGLSYSVDGGGVYMRLADGGEMDPDQIYQVIVNDFMYAGGDDYLFGEQVPEAYDTGVNWRQPVIDYIKSLASSPEQPLESFLDDVKRR